MCLPTYQSVEDCDAHLWSKQKRATVLGRKSGNIDFPVFRDLEEFCLKKVKMRKMAISRAKWRVVGPVKAYNMRNHKAHRRETCIFRDSQPKARKFGISGFFGGHYLGLGRQKC